MVKQTSTGSAAENAVVPLDHCMLKAAMPGLDSLSSLFAVACHSRLLQGPLRHTLPRYEKACPPGEVRRGQRSAEILGTQVTTVATPPPFATMQDGDITDSSSWTCSSGEVCELTYDMEDVESLEQVRIGKAAQRE